MNVDRKIVGVFRTIDDAALVINELNEKGYSADNISAIAKDQKEIEHLEEKSGEKVNHETAHKADIFSATGLVAGGVAGGLGGLLTGLGILAVSGMGPIVASRTDRGGYWRSWYWRRSWKFNRSIYRIRNSRRTC